MGIFGGGILRRSVLDSIRRGKRKSGVDGWMECRRNWSGRVQEGTIRIQ